MSGDHNIAVMRDIYSRLKKDALSNAQLTDLLVRAEDIHNWPYVLFLSDKAYIQGVYVDYQHRQVERIFVP